MESLDEVDLDELAEVARCSLATSGKAIDENCGRDTGGAKIAARFVTGFLEYISGAEPTALGSKCAGN